MSIMCRKCAREYDVTLFEFENEIRCECGQTVDLKHQRVIEIPKLSCPENRPKQKDDRQY